MKSSAKSTHTRMKKKAYSREKRFRKNFLFTIVFVVSFFYIIWRLIFTLPYDRGVVSMIFGVILWVAESATVLETFTHFLNARNVKIPEMPVIDDEMYPDVDVMIATHNESAELLYKTLNGCKYMKYPDKSRVHIYICDDGNRPEIHALCDEMGVGYFGFSGNKYAKAGNLNYALPQTHSPLIAIFDADMIPTSDFLLETVPYFFRREMILDNGTWRKRTENDPPSKEKPLGYVQTQQSFYNADPLQRNLYKEDTAPNEQDYFYRSVNVSRMATDSAAFAGSNTLFLRQALEDIGGFEVHSITEDFVTGISILGRGYTSYALPKELAHGLSPEDVYSFIKQRQRWSRGAAQGITNKKFWRSGLPLRAKWNFLVSYFYWWTFVRRFIFILCPILYGLFQIHVADVTFLQLIAVWFPYYIIYNIGLRSMSGGTTSALWSDTIDTIQFPYMMWPIIAGTLMIPQKKFFVTPKDRQEGRNSSIKLATPQIILALLDIFTIIICIRDIVINQNQGSIIVLFWASYNLYALFNAIIYYFGRSNSRQSERMPIILPVTIHAGGRTMEAVTSDISEGGMAVKLSRPEYLPIDHVAIDLEYKDYRASVTAQVVQVQQMQGGEWQYSLKLDPPEGKTKDQYYEIIYDRDHFFPRTIDMGVVKDMRKVFRGLTAKAKQGERRLPRINMYARLNSPEIGEVYAVNFNYKFILLHAKRALPESLTVNLSGDIQIRCTRSKEQGGRMSNTELYLIEDWESLVANPRYYERILALAAEASKAEESPEVAEISEKKRKEKIMRKQRRRRQIRVAATVAAFAALFFALLPDAARELAEQTGMSPDMIKTLYHEAGDYIAQGDYAEAIRALTDIRSYKGAEQKYEDSVVSYRLAVLDEAQDLNVAGEYPKALSLLRSSQDVLADDEIVASKISSVESKYIRETFALSDDYVAENDYEAALSALHALEENLGRAEPTIPEKVDEVLTAYRRHYISLAQAKLENGDFANALALLDEGEERTGTDDMLIAKREEVIIAYKNDFLTRANASLDTKAFDEALAILADAANVFPDDSVFPARIIDVKAAKAGALAGAEAEAGRYPSALDILDTAIADIGGRAELLAARAEIASTYVTVTLAQAEAHMGEHHFEQAVAVLEEALAILPEDTSLAETLSKAKQDWAVYEWLREQIASIWQRIIEAIGK